MQAVAEDAVGEAAEEAAVSSGLEIIVETVAGDVVIMIPDEGDMVAASVVEVEVTAAVVVEEAEAMAVVTVEVQVRKLLLGQVKEAGPVRGQVVVEEDMVPDTRMRVEVVSEEMHGKFNSVARGAEM